MTGTLPTQELESSLAHAAHFLPAQAPLEVFVHHNTLHALEHLPFHQALVAANAQLGAQPYLREEEYREALRRGRIQLEALMAQVQALPPLAQPWPKGLPPLHRVRLLCLQYGLQPTTAVGLRWLLQEEAAAEHLREDLPEETRDRLLRGAASETQAAQALYGQCQELAALHQPPQPSPPPPPRFPRDFLIRHLEQDPVDLVHPVLIPLAGAFLDRGQAHLPMPDREEGFYGAWKRVATAGFAVRPPWLLSLGQRLRSLPDQAEEVVAQLVEELGLGAQLRDFVTHTLLLLPGWAGMFHRLEAAPGPGGRSVGKVRLVDFLAVRLLLDVHAYQHLGAQLGFRGPLRALGAFCQQCPPLFAPQEDDGSGQCPPHLGAWPLYQLAQLCGLAAEPLRRMGLPVAQALLQLQESLPELLRLRLWHEAYERSYADDLLCALTGPPTVATAEVPVRFQVVTCIDDRSESLRRHLEAHPAGVETLGAAGFFNLAIAYQGMDDPSTFPLCPVVVQPQHRILEQPVPEHQERAASRLRWRRRLGRLETAFVRASRSLLWGPLVTAAAGFASALPLLANVFFPRGAAWLRRLLTQRLLPPVRTQLTQPRQLATEGEAGEGALLGFSVEEKANRVGTLLENMGLVKAEAFAPLVLILGHDSSSVNNPHFAAYSCGACGGRSGGPNARLMARMANRKEVRALLLQRGVHIPEETVFVGGTHDTCTDRVQLHDVDGLAPEARERVAELEEVLGEVLQHNAQERCRRFASAGVMPSPKEAQRHVEERSFDLSQARPELGHATNAACLVGRRALSRGRFLDRRAFLVSYDPREDPHGLVLERLLLAVGPVGAGINLEYYFSRVDNERLGAGTKLPHNVTGLLGVMNGVQSDLRTGLPKQMIEIHEPVRLHLVLETSADQLRQIMERQPMLANLIGEGWVRVATQTEEGFVPFEGGPC